MLSISLPATSLSKLCRITTIQNTETLPVTNSTTNTHKPQECKYCCRQTVGITPTLQTSLHIEKHLRQPEFRCGDCLINAHWEFLPCLPYIKMHAKFCAARCLPRETTLMQRYGKFRAAKPTRIANSMLATAEKRFCHCLWSLRARFYVSPLNRAHKIWPKKFRVTVGIWHKMGGLRQVLYVLGII